MKTQIEYTPSFVAFVDILGYSDLVKGNNDEKSINEIKRLSSAIKNAKDSINSRWSYEEDKFVVKVFSDCMCISIPEKIDNFDAFFQITAYVQANLMKEGICIRGGVARGKFYSDDNIIFSNGLVKAYEIEENIAKFPRIIIPYHFWSYVAGEGTEEEISWFKNTYTWRDYDDDQLFIDYLNFIPYKNNRGSTQKKYNLETHKSFIENCLNIYTNEREIYAKYEWMANYHNSWCKELYPQYPELLIQKEINLRKLGPFQ